ncbi:Uu.00g070470.m01.CDS01 [Anthostomella pinea]|uniref:Uu.00g070470.m01.CDS01 n=1 Tax=Anthostomella pinea TaxID=933095 RepID=A0AAI8VUQ1_9PEZI|nr:Uu.00g070470.m01.CDS01 [Anthostomella pinea]
MEHRPETPPNPSGPSSSPTALDPRSAASLKKEKGRVRFNSSAAENPPPVLDLSSLSPIPDGTSAPKPKIRPSVLRGNSYNSVTSQPEEEEDKHDPSSEKAISANAAHARAQQFAARLLGSHSAPGSRRTSLDSEAETVHSNHDLLPPDDDGIPLDDFNLKPAEGLPSGNDEDVQKTKSEEQKALKAEAYDLVRSHTQRHRTEAFQAPSTNTATSSAQIAPSHERHVELYVPPPPQFRGSVLSNLLKLYKPQDGGSLTPSYPHSRGKSDGTSGFNTPTSSGALTPNRKKWYDKNRSQDTLANLVEASARLAKAGSGLESSSPIEKSPQSKRPKHKRNASAKIMNFGRPRMEDEIRITMHIAETLSRQKYIIKMCKALMLYGAPTHRLEEYLRMTARVLEIDGQFLYLPGCMIISFDDKSTHTTEVKIVRTTQGIDLGKLKDVHEIYKSVLHDLYSVDEAIEQLSAIMEMKDKFSPWLRVLVFGLASAAVAPFGFEGRLIDLPVCFFLGCLVGALQIIYAPKSDLYNNVFEISAAVLTSFLARAFGSIRGGELFCFSALAQSSIALILPGWFVLCSALELQSRALVPGSIRMVYAIIYSLFLGFGITVGTALYGLVDSNATSATSCTNTMPTHYRFIFVPIFTICLAFVNQAKWKQMPVMILIAFAGYVVNFFSGPKFKASPQIANTLGAFTIGVLANLYSRLRHGVAVTALLPAIFVQVPSGLAATGSLLSGLSTANELNNSTHPVNGTTSTVTVDAGESLNDVVYNVAGSMIQIAIGITLGLFLSALIVYPFGKRRSGLWTL